MGSLIFSDEREDQFYDARDDLSSVWDLDSDCSEDSQSSVLCRLRYEVWAEKLGGVMERRMKFLRWMGLDLDHGFIANEDKRRGLSGDEIELDVDRVRQSSGAVLRTSVFKEGFSFTESSSVSCLSTGASDSTRNGALQENFFCKAGNLNVEQGYAKEEFGQGDMVGRLCVVARSEQLGLSEEFRRDHGPSFSVEDARHFVDVKKKAKRGGWLRRLGIGMCVVDTNGDSALSPGVVQGTTGAGLQRVQVYSYRKCIKELSSLHAGQEFKAHEGSILKMKFSLDGHYLASAGEDGIVRVWRVNEDERSNKFDIASDSSCQCFTIDHLSKLDPLVVDKEKHCKANKFRRSSHSACVMFPPKMFNILDKPLHEFRGHSGQVLDLSWSSKGFLLSSSIDKTVRLWQVGCDRCLRVFCHNNYVTCVDFNPLDDNYFISGSIDGKVRIWEVCHCRVVDYIDIREIVTAVSYRPDGKGGIVGSMTGTCLFYNIIDDRLQLDAQICLQGKKKSAGNRITGFQFTPSDPSKVMVTSADSLVRIVCRNNVICQFRGLRNTGSQMSASFTSDGKHIVSATDDSSVYIWNYTNLEKSSSHTKSIWSSESFLSHNASIAIPWCGSKTSPDAIPSPTLIRDTRGSEHCQKHPNLEEHREQKVSIASPDCFSLSGSLESLPRGTATWPEEKLVNSSPMAISPTTITSKFRLLRSALQSMSGSPHMWGLVIVTAGWDGRIRTFLNYGLPIRI